MDDATICEALRAAAAPFATPPPPGFDLVYVYAGHAFGGLHHFLSPRYNDRHRDRRQGLIVFVGGRVER